MALPSMSYSYIVDACATLKLGSLNKSSYKLLINLTGVDVIVAPYRASPPDNNPSQAVFQPDMYPNQQAPSTYRRRPCISHESDAWGSQK